MQWQTALSMKDHKSKLGMEYIAPQILLNLQLSYNKGILEIFVKLT